MNRKQFLGFTFLGIASFLNACKKYAYTVISQNDNSNLAHQLKNNAIKNENIIKSTQVENLIIGAGISGLTTAYYLNQSNKEFQILELGNAIGGNSFATVSNEVKCPWGAHYLPIPHHSNIELINFLKRINVVVDFKDNLPVYNEEYICFSPKERLFLNGSWQEGLIPHNAINSTETQEIKEFFNYINQLKNIKDKQNNYLFFVPFNLELLNTEFENLNETSALKWLKNNKYQSPHLINYINYCIQDDYGLDIKDCSALLMLNYFAARKGKGQNTEENDVLTWQEGNYFLADKLAAELKNKIELNTLAYKIIYVDNKYEVYTKNIKNEHFKFVAKNLIVATPHHVNKKIFCHPSLKKIADELSYLDINHNPWIVANIFLHKLPNEKQGLELAWDNVVHANGSLGYINSTHQILQGTNSAYIFTYYKTICNQSPQKNRLHLYEQEEKKIAEEIISELELVHNNIRACINKIVIKKLGHGMLSPQIGLHTKEYFSFKEKHRNNLHFIHTDYCGFSVFEEAFYAGINTAKKIINQH